VFVFVFEGASVSGLELVFEGARVRALVKRLGPPVPASGS
jgi:hypothetical protein